jgi:hypothetical protein
MSRSSVMRECDKWLFSSQTNSQKSGGKSDLHLQENRVTDSPVQVQICAIFLAFKCQKMLASRHDQTVLKWHNIGPHQTHCSNGLPTAVAASMMTIGSPVPFYFVTMSSVDEVLWLQVPDGNHLHSMPVYRMRMASCPLVSV